MMPAESFSRAEAEAMGAFHEDALSLEDVLEDQDILELIEQGVDVTDENE